MAIKRAKPEEIRTYNSSLPTYLISTRTFRRTRDSYYLVCQTKTQDFKTRTPYNIKGAKNKPSCMRAYAGLIFSRKCIFYP